MGLLTPALVMWLVACSGGAPDSTQHTTLDLAAATSPQPWTSARGASSAAPLRLTSRFQLPDTHLGQGSALVLEGLWWTATVTVNGAALPPVTGGNATVEVAVGAHLVEGENTIVVDIVPPTTEMPVELGGGLASSSFARDRPTLQAPPRLVIRPAHHLRWATLRLEGDQVVPVAQVQGEPGQRVRFSWEGGDLGSATVDASGVAQGAPVPWFGPRWAPGAPAFVALTATLEPPRGGSPLDRLVERVGVRAVAVSEGALQINGADTRLVGARVTNRPDLGDLPSRLSALLPAGVNALEIHGELPRSDWLSMTDEIGFPVVFVPRCVGRTRRGSRPTDATLTLQRAQDDRFLADLAHNPSVLLWVGEGPSPRSQANQPAPILMWTDHLLSDPLRRPVVQHDLPDRFLRTEPPGSDSVVHHSCQTEPCEGSWIVEVTWEGPTVPAMWPAMATAFSESLAAGAVGGVVPTPERHDVGNWLAAFRPTLAALDVPPVTVDGHRATALLRITGGRPGETVWVTGDGVPPRGAVLDASGAADLPVWASGPVQIQGATTTTSITVQPRRWEGLQPVGTTTTVSLSGTAG